MLILWQVSISGQSYNKQEDLNLSLKTTILQPPTALRSIFLDHIITYAPVENHFWVSHHDVPVALDNVDWPDGHHMFSAGNLKGLLDRLQLQGRTEGESHSRLAQRSADAELAGGGRRGVDLPWLQVSAGQGALWLRQAVHTGSTITIIIYLLFAISPVGAHCLLHFQLHESGWIQNKEAMQAGKICSSPLILQPTDDKGKGSAAVWREEWVKKKGGILHSPQLLQCIPLTILENLHLSGNCIPPIVCISLLLLKA